MSQEDTPRTPWYGKLLTEPNIYVIAGCLLVLMAFGTVKIGDWIAFNPSEDIPHIARYVLVLLGFLLLLIAVGMPVTRHPPHRSRRAQFTHRAPTSGE